MLGRLRRWAQNYTRRRRYSPLDMALHWTTAALVLFQLWWGFRTGHLPAGHDKAEAYVIHSQIGLLILCSLAGLAAAISIVAVLWQGLPILVGR